jgi:hypothetical protein
MGLAAKADDFRNGSVSRTQVGPGNVSEKVTLDAPQQTTSPIGNFVLAQKHACGNLEWQASALGVQQSATGHFPVIL